MMKTTDAVSLEPFAAETVPLRSDGGSGYYVGRTRVPLDTVISAYLDGATPEEIARHYSTLDLADVHAVVAYYLRLREQVHAYLEARQKEAEARARKEEEKARKERETREREIRKAEQALRDAERRLAELKR